MNLSLPNIANFLPPDLMYRIRVNVIGIAQDFWKDGGRTGQASTAPTGKLTKLRKRILGKLSDDQQNANASEAIINGRWKADSIKVKEKIWGPGNVLPINEELRDKLVKPLGLTKGMSALDLVAGLGDLARRVATDYGTYVTGLESDPEIAERGMKISTGMGLAKHAEIEAYDPKSYKPTRHYDCIIMRELFFRVPDKAIFLKTVLSSLKENGQIAFTDYCLESKDRTNESVAAWLKRESGASPVAMEDLAKVLGKMGLDVRTHEDLTDLYLKEITKGLAKLAQFIAQHPPVQETKPLVLKEIEKWAHRAAALQHGLKFYRFYAIRH